MNINKNLSPTQILKILSSITTLIPIFLISGPLLTDISISIIAISFFFFINHKKYTHNFFVVFFIIFCLILLISSSFAEYKILSFKSSLFYFRFGLFSIFFWFLIDKNKKILVHLFYILLFCYSILIIDSIIQYFYGSNIFNVKAVNQSRISSFFGDELKMGSYLMRLAPLFASLFFLNFSQKKEKKYIPYILSYIFLIQFTIYLSGERTSFFLYNFMIILFLIFINNNNLIKVVILTLYVVLTFILVTSDNPHKKRLIDRTLNHTQILDSSKKTIIFSQKYNEHYISAYRIYKDNKIIGIGVKNFREICKKEKYNLSKNTCSNHPHNIVLQLMSETGLIGFSFYLFLNIFFWSLLIKSLVFRLFYKKLIFKNFQISLLLYFVITLWPIAPYGNFFNNWLSALLYFPAGILLWSFGNTSKIYPKKLKINFFKNYFTK